MAEASTVVLGIPVPSTDPVFLSIVGVHVVLGLTAVVAGAVAMFSPKGHGRHTRYAVVYFWCLFGVFVTMGILSALRWAENYPLFIIGTVAFAAACFGRESILRGHARLHLAGMASSYILMLTAFYVDNGKNLPLWNQLPLLAFWFVPSIVGLPLVIYYLFRLPAIRKVSQ